MINQPLISFIIPAFNEEGNIKVLCSEIIKQVPKGYDYELILVDDGSSDQTLEIIKQVQQSNSAIHFISFSRNFGHQQAIKAGIDKATGDAVIMMDADLQHPPQLISEMIDKWQQGFDVVYTVRKDNKSTGFLKRKTSKGFYGVMNRLSGLNLEEGSADFRLINKKVAQEIRKLNDPYLFLRGLIPWMGFNQCRIEYLPQDRFSGTTKYSFGKMLKFAANGITSFSVKPLHLATLLGLFISGLSFLYGTYAIVMYFLNDETITGWASILTSVLFIGGIQLIILGIIGEYLGKIYMQMKNRPNYIVKETSLIKKHD